LGAGVAGFRCSPRIGAAIAIVARKVRRSIPESFQPVQVKNNVAKVRAKIQMAYREVRPILFERNSERSVSSVR
jgi:hypothetical protein